MALSVGIRRSRIGYEDSVECWVKSEEKNQD